MLILHEPAHSRTWFYWKSVMFNWSIWQVPSWWMERRTRILPVILSQFRRGKITTSPNPPLTKGYFLYNCHDLKTRTWPCGDLSIEDWLACPSTLEISISLWKFLGGKNKSETKSGLKSWSVYRTLLCISTYLRHTVFGSCLFRLSFIPLSIWSVVLPFCLFVCVYMDFEHLFSKVL